MKFSAPDPTKLARTLKTTEYFTLAFGVMIGVGWLIVIDDWLIRGGPGGAMLGFLLGGILLIPVAYVYGKFVREIPDSGTELAYATSAFGPTAGFCAGWLMTLAYLIVCPWEAVALGRILAYLYAPVQSIPLYEIANMPVYLPSLVLGLAATFLVIFMNYRGIRISSRFLNYTTLGLLISFGLFALLGITRIEPGNYHPFFAKESFALGPLVSIILVLQIVPYFVTGFESVPKCAEEAEAGYSPDGFSKAIYLSLAVGVAFYCTVIIVVGGLVPWQTLTSERYATAVAFERAFHNPWIVRLILITALISLLKVFNANFLAASRLVFALGRSKAIPAGLGKIHAHHQTPYRAVLFCGFFTIAGAFLGQAILIPVTEVGSLCSALGWAVTCVAFVIWIRRANSSSHRSFDYRMAIVGAAIAFGLILLKVIPSVPGSFGPWEYVSLAAWLAVGFALRKLVRYRATEQSSAG